jgi:hypothetical protein
MLMPRKIRLILAERGLVQALLERGDSLREQLVFQWGMKPK